MVNNQNQHLNDYILEQSLAEKMIPAVGDLYRERGVIVTVFGRKLMSHCSACSLALHALISANWLMLPKRRISIPQTRLHWMPGWAEC